MPAVFFLAWLLTEVEPLTFAWPAFSLIALQLVASLLMLWVLTLLFPRRPQALIGLAVYLFTPLGLVASTWWAFGLQALPLQISLLGAVGSYVMLRRNGRRPWMVAVVLSLVFGLAFWEKAVLVGPLLLGVAILLLDQTRDLRHRVRLLVSEWRLWMVLFAVAVCYLLLYSHLTTATKAIHEAPSIRKFFEDAVLRTLLPGLLGGPWTGSGAENTLAATPSNGAVAISALVFVIVLCWSFLVRGGVAALGWGFGLGYLLIDLGLILTQRSDFASFLARDPRYIADAIPVLIIAALAAFFVPGAGPAREIEVARHVARPEVGAIPRYPTELPTTLVAVGAVIASCWVSVVAVEDVVQHPYSGNFVRALEDGFRRDPAVQLVDSPAPTPAVVIQPVSVVFRALGLSPGFGQPTTDLRIVDGFGRFLKVDIPDPEAELRGPRRDCGWLVGHAGETIRLPFSRPDAYERVVRVGYSSGEPVAVSVSVNNQKPSTLTAADGLGYLYLTSSLPVRTIRVWAPEVGRELCVSDVSVGQPWPQQ